MSIGGDTFVDDVPDENLRDALRAAAENITILEGVRDRTKLELQRLRERSSVELAEAKVQHARLLRTHNDLATKVNRLEAECDTLRLEVSHLRSARGDFIGALTSLIEAHSQTSDA